MLRLGLWGIVALVVVHGSSVMAKPGDSTSAPFPRPDTLGAERATVVAKAVDAAGPDAPLPADPPKSLDSMLPLCVRSLERSARETVLEGATAAQRVRAEDDRKNAEEKALAELAGVIGSASFVVVDVVSDERADGVHFTVLGKLTWKTSPQQTKEYADALKNAEERLKTARSPEAREEIRQTMLDIRGDDVPSHLISFQTTDAAVLKWKKGEGHRATGFVSWVGAEFVHGRSKTSRYAIVRIRLSGQVATGP